MGALESWVQPVADHSMSDWDMLSHDGSVQTEQHNSPSSHTLGLEDELSDDPEKGYYAYPELEDGDVESVEDEEAQAANRTYELKHSVDYFGAKSKCDRWISQQKLEKNKESMEGKEQLTRQMSLLVRRLQYSERKAREASQEAQVLNDKNKTLEAQLSCMIVEARQYKEMLKEAIETVRQSVSLATKSKMYELVNRNLRAELEDLASHLGLRVRTPPSTRNWINGHVSVSVHGKYFAFIGPRNISLYLPSSSATYRGVHLNEKPANWWTDVASRKHHICEMGWGDAVVVNSQEFKTIGEDGKLSLECKTGKYPPPLFCTYLSITGWI